MTKEAAIVTGTTSVLRLMVIKSLLAKVWSVVVVVNINPLGSVIAQSLGFDVLWPQAEVANWKVRVNMIVTGFERRSYISLLVVDAGISTDGTASPGAVTADEDGPPRNPVLRVFGVDVVGTPYGVKLLLYHCLEVGGVSRECSADVKGNIVTPGPEGGLFALPYGPRCISGKHASVGLSHSLDPGIFKPTGSRLTLGIQPVTSDKYDHHS